jgi:hypothetical protein
VIDVSEGIFNLRGSLVVAHAGRLFVADEIAYIATEATFAGGYTTVSIANPASPVLISDVDATNIAAKGLVLNGAGLALTVGSPGGLKFLQLLNSTNPTDTDDFIAQFALPADPSSIALANGFAHVADGAGGLAIINYVPLDTKGQAPTIDMTGAIDDFDPGAPGLQATTSENFRVRPRVSDDRQVRNVELLFDGVVVQTDLAYPFEFSLPLDMVAANIAVELRATDTGGNRATSAPLVVGIVQDTTPPRIVKVAPHSDAIVYTGPRTVTIDFSERMNAATLTASAFSLVPSGGGAAIAPTSVLVESRERAVDLIFNSLGAGGYDLLADGDMIEDRAGNALGGDVIRSQISVGSYVEPGSPLPTSLPLG